MLTKRNSGEVTYGFEVRRNNENREIMKLFLRKMGHNPEKIMDNWIKVNKTCAKNILTYALSKNMTHDIDLETKPFAEKISDYFLEKFRTEAVFYTNGKFDSISDYFKLYSWTTITNSRVNTFDTGIIAFDNVQIGILWATDPI